MYTYQIRRLEFIIDSWEEIRLTPKNSEFYYQLYFKNRISLEYGLCFNCGLCKIEPSILFEIFNSFPKFSGDSYFPLGEKEYNMFNNFADNPDRLELAIHTMNRLKELQHKR